jgi:hypothetical protein
LEDPGDVIVVGLHPAEDSVGVGVAPPTAIAPPAVVVGIAPPSSVALIPPATETGTLPAADDVSLTATLATTPLPILLLLMPVNRQMVDPGVELHWTDLPAAVAAEPAVTLTDATLVVV